MIFEFGKQTPMFYMIRIYLERVILYVKFLLKVRQIISEEFHSVSVRIDFRRMLETQNKRSREPLQLYRLHLQFPNKHFE